MVTKKEVVHPFGNALCCILCTFLSLLFCEKPTITFVDNWFEQTNTVDTKRITKGNGKTRSRQQQIILFGVMCVVSQIKEN